jgi:hypothetical protein
LALVDDVSGLSMKDLFDLGLWMMLTTYRNDIVIAVSTRA